MRSHTQTFSQQEIWAEVRRHALILHEQVRSDIQLLAEHVAGLGRY